VVCWDRFSGITEDLIKEAKHTLEDAQRIVRQTLTDDAILVGHSVENDFKALKLVYPWVIDTGERRLILSLIAGETDRIAPLALLFPHPRGPPYKSSLKYLAKKWLKRDIQNSAEGHDSAEDAIAALELAMKKVCFAGSRQGSTSSGNRCL